MTLLEPGSFIKTAEQVEGLDGLAAGALHEVVNGACHNQSAGAAVESPSEVETVGLSNVLGVRQNAIGQQSNEGFLSIRFGEAVREALGQRLFFLGRFEIACGRQILRGENAARNGNEVRGKLDGDRFARGQGEFLFDLGQVSMFGDAVGADAFVAFGIQKGTSALRPAPLTPLRLLAIMPVDLIRPAFNSGAVGRRILVG